MNRLLEQLRSHYGELVRQYDDILDRCANEARDPSQLEAGTLEGLRAEMEPLGERIVQMRDVDSRRLATMTALADYPTIEDGDGDGTRMIRTNAGDGGLGAVRTRPRPAPLWVGDEQLRSAVDAAMERTAYSQPIKAVGDDGAGMQTRAAITTPAGGIVPTWLPSEPSGREQRIADLIAFRGGEGNQADYLATTTPASIAAPTAEGAPKPDSGLVVGRRGQPYDKGAAHSDVSSEMLSDFADAQNLVNVELAGALTTFENARILAAILADADVLAPALTATSRLGAILEVRAAIRGGPAVTVPDLVLVNPGDFPSIAGEVTTGSGALMFGPDAAAAEPAATVWGMRLVETIAVALGTVVVGSSAGAAFFQREAPRLVFDPYSQSVNNLVRVIIEERFAAALLNPAKWAHAALPGAAELAGVAGALNEGGGPGAMRASASARRSR